MSTEWAREYVRKMVDQARRSCHVNQFVGGRWTGRVKASVDDVARARLADQTVWVRKVVDGRKVIETKDGMMLDRWGDEDPVFKGDLSSPRTIHIPRSVVESWQSDSRVIAAEFPEGWIRPATCGMPCSCKDCQFRTPCIDESVKSNEVEAGTPHGCTGWISMRCWECTMRHGAHCTSEAANRRHFKDRHFNPPESFYGVGLEEAMRRMDDQVDAVKHAFAQRIDPEKKIHIRKPR